MSTARFSDGKNDAHGMFGELLSIDADAHLQKLAAHIFPSPALLPVELVRSALKRKATSISVQLSPGRIVIRDDGIGIQNGDWQALICLGDAGQGAAAREKAMAAIQGPACPGIGLLSVFLPGWQRIEIENAGEHGRGALRLVNGRSELAGAGAWTRGTRITIHRRRGPAKDEEMILARLCSAVPAEIIINSRPLEKKTLLTDSLVTVDVGVPPGQLAIPFRGDICRLWLLDQAIPWQVTHRIESQGLVFAAALEITAPPAPAALESLLAQADRLYYWLAENHARFPREFQTRIEELFFRRIRCGGDPELLSICAPFLAWPGPRHLTLADVRRRAASGSLAAQDLDGSWDRPVAHNGEMLLLSAAQKDFLIDHLRLPITFANAPRPDKAWPLRLTARLRAAAGRLHGPVRPAVTVEPAPMSREESDLCRRLHAHWRLESQRATPGTPNTKLSVRLIEGRGWAPARWLKTAEGDVLQLRRRHPLLLRALRSIGRDGNNIEWIFAAIMPGRFLTG